MFTRGLTRWLKLPGLARSASSVWVTPRGVKPDIIGIQRATPRLAHFLVNDWVARVELFEPVEAMFVSIGGELVAHPVTVGDRTDPVIRAFLDERLWLWQLAVLAVDAPAVFPLEPPRPGHPSGPKTDLGVMEVRVVDEVGQPLASIELELDRAGKKTKHTTDGSGLVRVIDVEESMGLVRIVAEGPVRDELRKRWLAPRGKPWLETGELPARTEIRVMRFEAFEAASVFRDELHTIILQPTVTRLLLHGSWFDANKSFMLPSAVDGVKFVVGHSRERPSNDLLVVGHTDASGARAYNTQLSLERAKATVAYLRRDVEHWYGFYSEGKPVEKRWGKHEDDLMIVAIAERREQEIPPHVSPVRWYQESRGLTVDGVAGSETRHALIEEYMKLPDAVLGEDAAVSAHGCGEDFPLPAQQGAGSEQQQRSVEVFLFENPIAPSPKPLAVLPTPPGETSQPGSKEQPEWVLRTRDTFEHRTQWDPPMRTLRIGWDSEFGPHLPSDLSFELVVEGGLVASIRWEDAVVDDGRRTFVYEPVMPTDASTLTAVFGDGRVVMWKDQVVGPSTQAISWLTTLADLLLPDPSDRPRGEGAEMPPDWHGKPEEEGDD